MSGKPKGIDPTEDIKKAVEKLAAFNQLNDSEGSLEKTINLMKQCLSVKFGDKGESDEKHDLLNAIDTLKRNYFILEQLQNGTSQQQKWAASIEGVIQKYNSIIEKAQQRVPSFTDKIAAYVAKQKGSIPIKEMAKINFPFPTKIQKDFFDFDHEKKISQKIVDPHIAASSKKIADLSQTVVHKMGLSHRQTSHLTKQALELFQMKVIALIEKNGILSNVEARQAVRTSHLQTYLHPDLTTCTVVCTLIPFPGQTITVNGSFEKSPRTGDYTIPNAKSFQLSLTSYQTGFPHPCQNTGNALPDLIPPYPHHLSYMPLLKLLYEEKQKLAHDLLESKAMIARAKQVYHLKKEAFERDLESMLQLHAQAAKAFVSHVELTDEKVEIIQNFYQHLAHVPNPYSYLSETHHIINENFSNKPHEKLKQEWVNRDKVDFQAEKILKEGIEEVLKELDEQSLKACSSLEKNTIQYIRIMGQTLAIGSHNILLQHLSESMGFAAPILNDFEKKMQILNFKQLKNFISDLRNEIPNTDRSFLLERLILEYTLWESSFQQIESRDPDAQIVKELQNYYNYK